MTAAPTISEKPFEAMSLDELKSERAAWDRHIDTAQGWGAALAVAIELRDMCDAWINRRLRQTEGDAIPPDRRLPDTNNLEEAAA